LGGLERGVVPMRPPNTAHTSRPWPIHDIAPDFRLEDVWELPGRGGPDDFPRVVQLAASFDPTAELLPRRPHALGDPVEDQRAARLGRP
jgi:hypothetical protein